MSKKISTSEIPDAKEGGIVKKLQPGNSVIKVYGISTRTVPFDTEQIEIVLSCEGEPIGGDFEGFEYDRDKPELGRALGKVGQVRAQQYAFKDGMAGKKQLNRDKDMLEWLMNFCKVLGKADWLKTQGDFDTVEELIAHINTQKPFKDMWLMSCLGGRGYVSGKGYLNYDLYLPWFNSQEVPLEMVGTQPSRMIQFNQAKHIQAPKDKPKEVESFAGKKSGGTELDLS